jgi:hypothetical protein
MGDMHYNIARRKNATIALVLKIIPLNVSFRRYLLGNNLIAWKHITATIMQTQLTKQRDTFSCILQEHGRYALHSMYRALAVRNGLYLETQR